MTRYEKRQAVIPALREIGVAVDDKASWKTIRTLAEDNKVDVTPLITKSKKVVTDDKKQDTTTEEKPTVTATTTTDSVDDTEYIV
jgi:hypothetical protein|tara:strand:- start:198 stop:452 length:255 start_codon:yes stop_codon:yes gene_type:complete